MRSHRLVLAASLACSSLAFAQSFEASIGGGQARFPTKNADIGTATADPAGGSYKMKDGFRLVFRMTLNSWRLLGHEFGYAYNRTSLSAPAATVTTVGTAPG